MSPSPRKPMDGEQLDRKLVKLFGENRQTVFAELLGCGPRTVRKWCSGELEVPRHIAMLVNAMIDHNIKPEELRA